MPLVILTDSRCEIQHIVGPYPIDSMIEKIIINARFSPRHRHVNVEWVTSYVEIPLKERADRLARNPHRLTPLTHVHRILAVRTVMCANYL